MLSVSGICVARGARTSSTARVRSAASTSVSPDSAAEARAGIAGRRREELRDALVRVLRIAAAHRATAVTIAGDLFETREQAVTHAGEHEEGRLVCNCFSLNEPYLRRKIKDLNLRTIPEVTNAIKAGGACMSCHHVPGGLQDLLDDIWGGDRKPVSLPIMNIFLRP